MKSPNKNNNLFTPLFVFITFLSISLLSACGGGGGDDPATQDAKGLYYGLGTLNSQSLNDLKGMVHNNRVMFFSATANLVIDGTISVTSDDFTGTVDVYENGALVEQATVAGQVTAASSIKGSITGSTVANGTFELTFDPLYAREATLAKIQSTNAVPWAGMSYSGVTGDADFSMIFYLDSTFDATDSVCSFDNGVTVIPSVQANIYSLTVTVNHIDASCGVISSNPGDYTGFSSIIDGSAGTDNTMLFVMTNGTNSIFSTLTK